METLFNMAVSLATLILALGTFAVFLFIDIKTDLITRFADWMGEKLGN